MADVRAHAEDGGWLDWGHTPTYVAADKFSVTGDQTAAYTVGRRVRLLDTTEKFGVITTSAYTILLTPVIVGHISWFIFLLGLSIGALTLYGYSSLYKKYIPTLYEEYQTKIKAIRL